MVAEFLVAVFGFLWLESSASAQNAGNSTGISWTVSIRLGPWCPDATVTIHNPVSGFERSATTDSSGNFTIPNVPFNPYHMTVTAKGFAPYVQDVDVRSTVPLNVKISLQLAGCDAVRSRSKRQAT